jgi:hypothetical protein
LSSLKQAYNENKLWLWSLKWYKFGRLQVIVGGQICLEEVICRE